MKQKAKRGLLRTKSYMANYAGFHAILIWYNYNQVMFLAMTSTLNMHIKVNAFHTLLVKLRKIHVNLKEAKKKPKE
jgi:hypothetical protein